jgi:hypothetical protein
MAKDAWGLGNRRTAMALRHIWVGLWATALLHGFAAAEYEYRYLEGEGFSRGEAQGLRDEGFTSWMRHPSGGQVAVFGGPAGGWLEYDIKGLGEGPRFLHIRCLDLPQTKTHVLWDGHDLGLITHEGPPATSLRWCKALGPLQGTGDHVLRLQGSDDSTAWPYIDVILLTDQPGYTPPPEDQDFVSFTTAWPLLAITDPAGPRSVSPLPGAPAQPSPITVEQVNMAPAVIGPNKVTLALRNTGPRVEVTVRAALSVAGVVAPPATAAVTLDEGQQGSVEVQPATFRAGKGELQLVLQAGQAVGGGDYPVTVAAPVTVALDEYAYASNVAGGTWTARFACAPELLPKVTIELQVRQTEPERTISTSTLKAAPEVRAPLGIGRLPIGRYEVAARFRLGDEVIMEDRREFIRYPAVALPAWEPVRQTKAVSDRLTLNGRPFLGLMLFHAAADEQTRSHGCTVVQCAGGDPDPLPQIKQSLDDCRKHGLYGTVALFNNEYFCSGLKFNLANLQKAAEAFKDHPALLGWDLIDEPDGAGMSPERVKEGADLLRQMDPNHFVWVNLCQSPKATDYLDSQDLWSFDNYPFPTLTPAAYRVWLNISDEKLAGRKPLGTCLQTYVYDRNQQRMPTPDELRVSAWLHIIHGYSWLGYYSYYDAEPAGCLGRDPGLWSYVRALNAELVSCKEAILGSDDWRVLRTEPESADVEAREKKVGGKRYVVVVNLGRQPASVTVKPGLVAFKSRLLFEADAPPEAGREITVNLRPTSARVFEVTQ